MSEQMEVAGMAWRDIAKSAYKAYAASTGNKNYQGLPMPEFEDLPQKIQTAWEASVRQADFCIRMTPPEQSLTDSEQQWKGWIPPHVTNL